MKRLFFSSLVLLLTLGTPALIPKAQKAQKQKTAATATPQTIKVVNIDELKKILERGNMNQKSRPLLVNFWATWCEPCRAEFPELVKIDQDYRARGLDLVLVSLDDVSDVKTIVPQFLSEMKATRIPVYVLNAADPDAAISAIDASWPGALPATFLFDQSGKLTYKHIGLIKPAELRTTLEKTLQSP